ncbi:MAG: TCR/Tet family MFS transporter [Bacteroidia bacterium]
MIKTKSSLIFIFFTLLIDCTGIGLIIPVVPTLIQNLVGGTISEAASYGGWLTFSYAAMQFFFSPILGGLSDQFGRRPVILISLLGLGLDYIFLYYAPTITWLFVGRIIAGVCGASFTSASAFIADISNENNRAQNFGMIGAAFGLGFIIGPFLGSIFSQYGVRVPFMIAAILSLLNFIYGIFVLPESLSKENRRSFDWKRANPFGSLIQLKSYPTVYGFIITLILLYIAGHAAQSTWTFYTIEKFQWNEQWVGYSIAFVGLSVAIVQGGLIKSSIKYLGQNKSVIIGLLFYILGFVLFSLASKGWMMFAFMIPYALGGIAGPALQSLISGQVPSNAQGELQGALTSLMSVTSIVGPLLMTFLFSYFTAKDAPIYFPGAPFLAGGVLTLIGTISIIGTLKKNS